MPILAAVDRACTSIIIRRVISYKKPCTLLSSSTSLFLNQSPGAQDGLEITVQLRIVLNSILPLSPTVNIVRLKLRVGVL